MSQLPSTNRIPAVLTNAKVYNEGNELYGTADIEVPSLEYMSETLTGLGIAGEVSVPVKGHFKALTTKIKWNSTNEIAISLMQAKANQLEVYASVQELDAGTGTYIDVPVKMVMKASPTKGTLGKYEAAKKMETEVEFNASYVKLWINGKEMLEVDPLNFICVINGVDELAEVRANLGM